MGSMVSWCVSYCVLRVLVLGSDMVLRFSGEAAGLRFQGFLVSYVRGSRKLSEFSNEWSHFSG